MTDNLETKFASPERSNPEKISLQAKFIDDIPFIHQLVDLIPDAFLILNQNRQIVFCNHAFAEAAGIGNIKEVYGMRPGEALHCVHADQMPAGCGTTEYCIYCGAVNTILKSQDDRGKMHCNECNVIIKVPNSALNFRVWARNLTFDHNNYTFFIARDISSEKRRSALERIFFHDILNTAGGIQGIAELLENAEDGELNELIHLIESSSDTLIEEIKAQKDILAAESGDLKLQITEVNSLNLLNDVRNIYLKHEVAFEKNIIVDGATADVGFKSDGRVIKRIVGNMLKNALEASSSGATVSCGANVNNGNIEFWVMNSGVMPKESQFQVFQRSFSTKGEGRGLGTYSIKLLGENYLKGQVSFSSEEGKGTIFRLALPLS